jgi:hypothetical protein
MELIGTPYLCILGSPYNLGDLETAGHICRRVCSGIDDFLSKAVAFRSIEPVESLVTFL